MSARIKVTRWADRKAQGWKNGGGVTYELMAEPAGSGLDAFDWRVSVAEVASDGPFSLFDGIDRTLILLEGQVELTVAGASQTLAGARSWLSFDGSAATSARLVSGPVRDLNVMTRRARLRHEISAIGHGALHPQAAHWFVFALEPDLTVAVDTKAVTLDRFDLLEGRGVPVDAAVSGSCWLIEMLPRSQQS